MNKSVDNPLVSFVVLAYNQEKYIREAVEGAFRQNYSPLDIILSDDNSSDSTYQIMLEMAEKYKGENTVRVRKSAINDGLVKHVLCAAEDAKGELIVFADGDDISMPERTTTIVKAWIETDAWGLYSGFDKISETGESVSKNIVLKMSKHTLRNYWSNGKELKLMHGAVLACRKDTFQLVSKNIPSMMQQDGFLSLILYINNKPIHLIEESLVLYRINPQALSNTGGNLNSSYLEIINAESKLSRMAHYFKNFNFWLLDYKNKIENVNSCKALFEFKEREVIADIKLYTMMSTWIHDSSFLQRFGFLIKYPRYRNWSWMLPRIFGLNFFAFIKSKIRK